MALFNVSVWQRSRFTLQWFIINLLGSLACLTAVALAQFEWSEGVSGSVSIPDVAFTCLGNLAVFMTAFTRGRLDVENGARDVLATTRGPKLRAINGFGLTTCRSDDLKAVDVVLLSMYIERPHSSSTQFMQYISHSHDLESILLQFLPFRAVPVTAEICKCVPFTKCHCVVFRATKEIMIMLAHRLPGTLKRLSESQCLLPCLCCLIKGCHGCNQGLLYVEDPRDVEAASESSELGTSEGRLRERLLHVEAAGESSEGRLRERLLHVEAAGESSEGRLREDNPRVDSPAAVCEALNESLTEGGESSCICIPVHPWNADRWTKFMIKFLKSKEKEAKGIKVVVSDALQHYITDSKQELGLLCQTLTGCIAVREIYKSASLILPRVAEVIVNMGLTGWLRVDGFSSSLVARRAIRDYVVDSAGTGFGANAFLTEAVVFCSADGTNVCQVLWFRGGILSARRVSYMVGCVNLICSITWSVLIACEGNWAPSTPLSTARLAVIIGAVGVALGMDCFELYGGKVPAWAGCRAEPRTMGRTLAQFMAKDEVKILALARAAAEVEAEAQAAAEAQAQAAAEAQARAGVLARAWSGALRLARALGLAQARAEAEAEALARTEAEGRARDRARARILRQVQARDEGWTQVRNQASSRIGAQGRGVTQDRGGAWVWGLVTIVLLEVGCIVSLVVMLSMKKGVGRWVYGGMQVLVWVKWGIGSFLLGDNATEEEDGCPFFYWPRNRGPWVYCSAFLLNAMLAGVRGKWAYPI